MNITTPTQTASQNKSFTSKEIQFPIAGTISEKAEFITQKAREARAYDLIALYFAGSGHSGSSLSMIDIVSALYLGVMNNKPSDPYWVGRDRLFLSGQHKCPAQYSIMGVAGYYPIKDFLLGLRALGYPFQGHPDWHKLPGIEMSGGSLGQGLGIAIGSALSARLNNEDRRTYCIMGDGEHQEGSVWEAVMCAAHHKISKLCVIVDLNKLQIDGKVCDVMNIEPIEDKYRAFGWNTIRVDGHSVESLLTAFEQAKTCTDRPTVILADTIKGKGVSFMEGKVDWHGKAPNFEQLKLALTELGYENLITDEILAEGKILRETIAKEYGNLIPKSLRPHWWNSEDVMKVQMSPTRFGFGTALDRIGSDERVVCLGADISGSICISDFHKNHPERLSRFFSMGVAEQNMTVVAAGLAKEGKIPVIGSYGVFITGRNWDQIRTTICHANLNVKIGVGHGGISVGPDGATHQSLEDITLMAILPNMSVFVPCDTLESDKATEAAVLKINGPVSVRFSRESTPVITKTDTPFIVGKANIYRYRGEQPQFIDAFECKVSSDYVNENEALTIIACGPEVPEAMRAAYILKKNHNIEARVINMHTIKPLDDEAILRAAKETGKIITVEEHQRGGVGNLIAGVITREGVPVKIAMIGVKDRFGESGVSWELVWKYGLAAEHIVESALAIL